jgi:DNA-binding CsgD family transcriptional regulator/CRP-like cAMP-binding protein
MTAVRSDNRLLGCLSDVDFAVLAPHLKRVPLNTGNVLQEQDTVVEFVYFPLSGVISLLAVMNDGAAVEAAMIGREGCVGLCADFGPWHACARAVVQAAGFAERIAAALFRDIAHKNIQIKNLMLRYKEALCAQIQQTAGCNALHSVEKRVARWLLEMLDRMDGCEVSATREIISQVLGARRTTITSIVGRLEASDLIRRRRGHIEVANRAALEKLACDCSETYRRRLDAVFLSTSDHAQARLTVNLAGDDRVRGSMPDPSIVLTERERQIMHLICEGLSNKDIGRRFNLSDGTVKAHLHHIYEKLAIHNRTALAMLAAGKSRRVGSSRERSAGVHVPRRPE